MRLALARDTAHDAPPAVVLDTNVVLDWLLFHDPHCGTLASMLEQRRLLWYASPEMRQELASVLSRPMLQRWQPDCERILSIFDHLTLAGGVDGGNSPGAVSPMCSRDPDDQKFIDLAVQVRARWLLSRDLALLRLARPARQVGIEILTPAHWQRLGNR